MATRDIQPGERFGRWTVIEKFDDLRFKCVCDCGKAGQPRKHNLLRGSSKSCGCLQRERAAQAHYKHGHGGRSSKGVNATTTYHVWAHMKSRCSNPNQPFYRSYGGRGIKVCERWAGDDGFANFLADMGEKPEGKSIDRIDPDGNYEPSNCRWATSLQQRHNRSKIASTFGEAQAKMIARCVDEGEVELKEERLGAAYRLSKRGLVRVLVVPTDAGREVREEIRPFGF